MKAIVLGLGPSMKAWERGRNEFVMGCNNIYDYQKDIEAICIVDALPRLISRRPTVFQTPDYIHKYCKYHEFNQRMKRVYHIPSIAHKFNNQFNYKTTPINHGYTCPFYATLVCMHLDYKEIEVYGVDHTGQHPLANKHSRNRSASEFAQLIKFAKTEGINIIINEACHLKPLIDEFLNNE